MSIARQNIMSLMLTSSSPTIPMPVPNPSNPAVEWSEDGIGTASLSRHEVRKPPPLFAAVL